MKGKIRTHKSQIMKKTSFILSMVALSIVTAGMIYNETDIDNMFATINLRIEKDSENIWRVRDLNENSMGSFYANSNDNVHWQNRGPQVVFSFAENVDAYFEYEDGIFEDGRSQVVGENENLKVMIKEDAPKGVLIYEVFVISEGKYVQGNSAPRMIIR